MQNRTFRIILLLFSLALCLSAGKTIIGLWQRRDVVSEREKELVQIQKDNQALEAKLKEIEGDFYVERIARDKLGMVKEGETIVILPEQALDSQDQNKELKLPNWKKWWRLFF